jgi:hypothetical protein
MLLGLVESARRRGIDPEVALRRAAADLAARARGEER